MYYGSWKINDYVTFAVQTVSSDVPTDADAVPTLFIYEDETATDIAGAGSGVAMAKLGSLTGLYTEQVQLTAAKGFEKGKSYTVHITWAMSSSARAEVHNFQVEAEVDANVISDTNVATTSDTAKQVLKEAFNNMTGDSTYCLLNALRATRNKFSISGTTITFYKENGTDTAFQLTLTTDADALPIIGATPA